MLLCHVSMQTCSSATGHRTAQDLSAITSWYMGYWLFHRLFIFPLSLERPMHCKHMWMQQAARCRNHADLIHHLQYLESDVMPIVFPTCDMFLMLHHRLCFPIASCCQRSLPVNSFISHLRSFNKLHKTISLFA